MLCLNKPAAGSWKTLEEVRLAPAQQSEAPCRVLVMETSFMSIVPEGNGFCGFTERPVEFRGKSAHV